MYAYAVHDYGAPEGFRIILAHPERLEALIIQNGNVNKEGLGAKWAKIAEYWADPKAHPEVVDAFLSFEATKQRHIAGTAHPERYNPDTWTDECAHLSKQGQREIQAAPLYDYRTNVASYPDWQAWLRQHKPATLVAWGRMTRRLRRPVARPSGAIYRTPRSTCSMPAIRPGREERRNREYRSCVLGQTFGLTDRLIIPCSS